MCIYDKITRFGARTVKNPNLTRLKSIISRFDKGSVLVIGDLILDEFIWGNVSRISPEAPVPVVWVKSENFMPGGCSNVASNICSLGGRAYVMGIVGCDDRGETLVNVMRESGIYVDDIFRDSSRPTTLKTRVIAHHQQVVRIDRENTVPLSSEAMDFFMKQLDIRMAQIDAVCIEDYGKGVITAELVRRIVRLARKHGKIITVDPKEDHLSFYKGVTALTPNHHEASGLSQIRISDDASLEKAGRKLLKTLSCENVLITRGEQGMALFQNDRKAVSIPTMAQDVYDVSGAGDTVIATFTLARAMKALPVEAAFLANYAAGVVVGKVGTAAVTREELLTRVAKIKGRNST